MREIQKIFSAIETSKSEIEDSLKKIFKNKKLKITNARIIKEQKIVALKLKNNKPTRVVLHKFDHPQRFKRTFFALKRLKDLIPVPQFFGKINQKIIIREYFLAKPFYFLILDKMPFDLLLEKVGESAQILVNLHSLNTQKLPHFLSNDFASNCEKRDFLRTSRAFIPQIFHLKSLWESNLELFLEKENKLRNSNPKCLVHGDFHPANLMIRKNLNLLLIDFDIMEVGNPAKDLGKFIAHLKEGMKKAGYSSKKIEMAKNLFLRTYFEKIKIDFYPNFKENFNLYMAGMNLHIARVNIYHLFLQKPKKIKKERIEKIKRILLETKNLLQNKK